MLLMYESPRDPQSDQRNEVAHTRPHVRFLRSNRPSSEQILTVYLSLTVRISASDHELIELSLKTAHGRKELDGGPDQLRESPRRHG